MSVYRLKHTFTAGELSPMMSSRLDFKRYKNGCSRMENMYAAVQGPAVRRNGFQFIYSLNDLGIDVDNPQLRVIPFIFNEIQSYAMIFYRHIDGTVKLIFATTKPDGEEGLVVYEQPLPTECPVGTPIDPPAIVGNIVTLPLPADWDIENFDYAQSADEMYIAQSGTPPNIIVRHSHTCWELKEVTFTDQPVDWDDDKGWPEKVTFHQQRLAFAANILRPQTVWMSKAGNFDDFGTSSPLVDADAVTFTLDSGTQNKIQWLVSGKDLNIGTLGNEWTVEGNDQTSLTPNNILAKRQTNRGSEPLNPLLVNMVVIYLARFGRAIHEFRFEYSYDSFSSADLSILAPHLTERYSIVDWSFQQTPDSVIWCVREDGVLLGFTYQQQHEVYAWHRHTTDGDFKALTSIPGNTREDDLWVVIKRIINGEDKYYIEKYQDQFIEDSAEKARFLDSYLDYVGYPTSILGGLGHLEGKTVDILADGTVHPPLEVKEGSITLNNTYTEIAVGLPYISELWPLLQDLEPDDGTSFGRMQRVLSIDIDFYKSLGVRIGRYDYEDGEHEEEKPFRVPGDLLGNQVPLYSGIVEFDFPEGYDQQVTYFIRQYQPLPLIVRGVVDNVQMGD